MRRQRNVELGTPLVLATLLCAGALACRTATRREPVVSEAAAWRAPGEWTQAFMQEALLVADEIHIEGPSDLLSHVAIQQDPEAVEYTTRTVSAGLLQELRSRPELGVEVRAQLDAWSLAGFRSMTILQRPGEVDVTLRAVGNAVWIAADGSGERRENTLVFQGVRGK